MKTLIEDWHQIEYAEAWKQQEELFNTLVAAKQGGQTYENRILLCEHPHVYTLGRSGKVQNMLLSDEQLQRIGATLFHIDRGGDITYHGPGQLVCYPILNLEEFGLGLKEYIHLLEEAVIRVCALYGIEAGRVEKATGVWLDGDKARARKICAIGVRSSHYVTMHGLALNVNTDLRYFSYINPCGFIDKGVTSLQKELGREIPMEEVKQRLTQNLVSLLGKERLDLPMDADHVDEGGYEKYHYPSSQTDPESSALQGGEQLTKSGHVDHTHRADHPFGQKQYAEAK